MLWHDAKSWPVAVLQMCVCRGYGTRGLAVQQENDLDLWKVRCEHAHAAARLHISNRV